MTGLCVVTKLELVWCGVPSTGSDIVGRESVRPQQGWLVEQDLRATGLRQEVHRLWHHHYHQQQSALLRDQASAAQHAL
jgi:hypothetical protein